MNEEVIIYVYADWVGLDGPKLMGTLFSRRVRGSEIFSFKYESNWLQQHQFQLDPDLSLYDYELHLQNPEKKNFGIFSDSSPDRWGELLMDRREAWIAKSEERSPRKLFQTDYLLGVHDQHRMGALRFKTDPDGDFLDNNHQYASPPWLSLRELEQASLKFENDELFDDPQYAKWVQMLLSPGASLGGARPKASVSDPNGHLWIAKFPSEKDGCDHGAWEYLVYQMALESEINMAPCQIKKFSSDNHTFLTKRFDRTTEGGRIHFASARTLLDYGDSMENSDGASYLELVDFLTGQGANTNDDLEELFRRVVFSICVSNCDDHLRNHGFILTDQGWRLSPAYDINPNEKGTGLVLNITLHDNRLDLNLAMEVHPFFRISDKRAIEIIEHTINVVSTWKERARQLGISSAEINDKVPAFEGINTWQSPS